MKFEFEINESELFEYNGWDEEDRPVDFMELLRSKVFDTLAAELKSQIGAKCREEANDFAKKIIAEQNDELVNRAVDAVAEKIAKKKQIVAMTPKASELAAANKENEEYFMSLIDAAIARRFKS